MKRTLLLSIAASISFFALADLTGAGYYRVHNYKTSRYVSVIDNRGKIDYRNTTADLQAVKLQKNYDEVCCDPAAVLYITPKGSQYQIETQGTGIYQIISHYVYLKETGSSAGKKLYNAYGQMEGVIKYLGDAGYFPFFDLGSMETSAKGDYIKWFISPINANSDNFFGVKPTFESDGKYYTTMYASFPFTPYSPGIKVYYIKGHYNGNILLEEATGTIAAGNPVLIECSTPNPSTNRLEVGGTGTTLSGNRLIGNYFNCSLGGHINRLAYNKDTMRVLGICSDGTLGFVKDESLDYIPANKCYISVTPGSPDEYKFVSQAEFDAGVDDITIDAHDIDPYSFDHPVDVYNLHGIRVLHNALPDDLESLPAGIYIANGRKLVIR